MGAIKLRPYQEKAKERIFEEWNAVKRTLLVLPTGTGKTIVIAKVTEECVKHGDRVLILAHRGELLEQAADKIYKATGLKSAVEKAEETCIGEWYRVVVGSVQTLQREKRLNMFTRDYFNTIIIDETHHALSNGYQNVLNYFNEAHVLGVTATPDRGDMKSLGEVFDSLAYEYTLPEAIKEGYLVPIKALTVPLKLDLSHVRVQRGDFSSGDLGTALDPYLDSIADEMSNYCKDRKTVVFLPLVKTSQKFSNLLNAKGFRSVEVNGESVDRKEKLEAFERGDYNVICNSMLLTEGWDCPSVDCVIVLRPTKVRALYSQMVGRGTRLSPGKKELLILDFLWHTERHELCSPTSLLSKNENTKKHAQKILEENAGTIVDVEEVEEKAQEDVIREREEALAEQLEVMRKRKKKLVDPLQFEMSIMSEDLSGYRPSFGWEMGPATEKQKAALEKFGINPDDVENAGKAKLLLDRVIKRKEQGLTTPKQIRLLERYGFKNVGMWQFADASNMISRIASNGWRLPKGIKAGEYKPAQDNALLDDTLGGMFN